MRAEAVCESIVELKRLPTAVVIMGCQGREFEGVVVSTLFCSGGSGAHF
jgi:hypothetical protein